LDRLVAFTTGIYACGLLDCALGSSVGGACCPAIAPGQKHRATPWRLRTLSGMWLGDGALCAVAAPLWRQPAAGVFGISAYWRQTANGGDNGCRFAPNLASIFLAGMPAVNIISLKHGIAASRSMALAASAEEPWQRLSVFVVDVTLFYRCAVDFERRKSNWRGKGVTRHMRNKLVKASIHPSYRARRRGCIFRRMSLRCGGMLLNRHRVEEGVLWEKRRQNARA